MGALSHVFSLASRKAILGIAGLIVIALVTISFIPPTSSNKNQATVTGTENNDQSQLLADNDNDNLPNWQETLWHTDPNKADTDEDGVSDGEEINQSHDPLAKGVGDLNSRSKDLMTSDGQLTTEFSKALIESGAIGAALNGESPSLPANYTLRVKTIYADTVKKEIDAERSHLHYSVDTSDAKAKAYINSVAEILNTRSKNLKKIDFEVFNDAISKSSDKPDLAGLDPLITAIDATINDVVSLDAPLSLKDFHERGVALLVQTRYELKALRNFNNDPALALVAIQNRLETRIAIAQLFNFDMSQWFSDKKIVFSDNEMAHIIFGI